MSKLKLENTVGKKSETAVSCIERLQTVANSSGYEDPESSINLVSDESISLKVKEEVKRLGDVTHVLLVGIGGSNLGTVATYDALKTSQSRKLLTLDTVDGNLIEETLDELSAVHDSKKIAVVLISKSGTTTESIANFEIVYANLRERFSDLDERIVVITDEGTSLWNVAETKGWARLAIPKMVGGRYSVFSAVGLLPLMLLGVDMDELLSGAREMKELCLSEGASNPAVSLASSRYTSFEAGAPIDVDFMFAPRLENVGKWHVQLLAESLGKNGKGVSPMVAVGSTDLHSLGQLLLDGKKDKFTTFVSVESTKSVALPKERALPSIVPMIDEKDTGTIMQAILGGTKSAYKEAGLPFAEIELSDVSARSIGELLMLWMIETMILGKMMDVNAFDQPAVESYKKETRRLIES